MIKRLTTYKIPLILTLVLFVFHLTQKSFTNSYERPIVGDAQAYYAYLPALFIYHDLSYDFVNQMNERYYPPEHQKSFLKDAGNGKVNKTFPGVAVLYLPFFLLAHALALLFGLDPDGYSTVYQICFDLGLWFYLACALCFMQSVLRQLKFSIRAVNWSIILAVLGTNIFFYSVYDQSVTHIYNLFLVNAFIYCLLRFRSSARFLFIGWAIALLVLMGITRPTNVLVLGLVVFLIPDFQFFKSIFQTIFKPKNLLKICLIALPILAVPFLLWKAQTGQWVVYSYGEEGFNFAHPHFREFLFSYLKGWFTYTPIAFFILVFGFFILFRVNKRQFEIGLGLIIVLVYVFSSWWCWYYGAGMSQRVMIDYTLILAFLTALIIDQTAWLSSVYSFKKIMSLMLVFGLMTLNIVQAYQIGHGILPGGSATQNQYWDNFLSLERRARVYPHDTWKLEEKRAYSLAYSVDSTTIIKGNSYLIEDEWMISVTAYDQYSATLNTNIDELRKGSKLIVRFQARARSPINETRAVVLYDDQTFVYGLDSYLKMDKWVTIEFMVEPNAPVIDRPQIYFWNGGSTEKVEFKDFEITHYFSAEYL